LKLGDAVACVSLLFREKLRHLSALALHKLQKAIPLVFCIQTFSMTGTTPFDHRRSTVHATLMESWCPLCRQFIAASPNLDLLLRAELQHECIRSLVLNKQAPERVDGQ
jgi:hypothetical protein